MLSCPSIFLQKNIRLSEKLAHVRPLGTLSGSSDVVPHCNLGQNVSVYQRTHRGIDISVNQLEKSHISLISPRTADLLPSFQAAHSKAYLCSPAFQFKFSLVQLEVISLCPIMRKWTDTLPTAISLKVVVESNDVSPRFLFLQAKQPQFPQTLITCIIV